MTEPPRCPECEESLTEVEWNTEERWEYDSESRIYTLKPMSESGETRCPTCGADLYELFPNGPINYGS